MRISALLFSLLISLPVGLRAQDPGAQQDAEAAREKLLKASDQLDMIESNSEATKTAVDGMKADISALQQENASLKQQLADLQAAFNKAEADHAKERQALLDSVAGMIASAKSPSASKPAKKKESPAEAPPASVAETDPAPSTAASASGTAAGGDAGADAAPPAKPQKGYYHIVENGETLTLICSAYREQGVNVTVSEIRKANGLTDKSVLKVGQKLFIPKPGT